MNAFGGGVTFVDIASARMANLQATLDAVISAENGVLNPILRALMIIYVGRQFFLCVTGNLEMRRFLDSIIRGLLIVFLVTHNGAFVQYVKTPIYTGAPQALSAMVAGNYNPITAAQPLAQQFDNLSAASSAINAQIDAVSTNVFSVRDWKNSISAGVADGAFQVSLALIVGIWLLGQTLLAIVLALFLPMLCFELFDRTRGFVDQIIAKAVGMTAFGFATSFVLALEMNGLRTMLTNIKAEIAVNAAISTGLFWHALGDGILDLLTIAVLPTAVGFGSGAVAALVAPSSMVVMRSLTLASTAMATAGRSTASAATAISRTAVSGGQNLIRRG